MNVTRRGLLGMFAAGAAAPFIPAKILMPVRKIITDGWSIDAMGVLRANNIQQSQELLNAWSAALVATIQRGSALVRIEHSLTVPGGPLLVGDVVKLTKLLPGDNVLSAHVDWFEDVPPAPQEGRGRSLRFYSSDVTDRLKPR